MSLKHQFELLASYNQWMNTKLYDEVGQLTPAELTEERGAFFGSILGSLNHIVVADTIWLKRFSAHPSWANALSGVAALPSPSQLDQILFGDLAGLAEHRRWLDQTTIDWVAGLGDVDLGFVLSYRNMKGIPASRRCSSLVLHFFNHQTHHRGQVTTLLSQAGRDVGVTDLLALIPEETATERSSNQSF